MISPYLERPLRTLDQALHERAASRAALREMPPHGKAPPAARSASDAGSAEALALLLRDCPAAVEIAATRRAA